MICICYPHVTDEQAKGEGRQVQCLMASKWHNQYSDPGGEAPEFMLLTGITEEQSSKAQV